MLAIKYEVSEDNLRKYYEPIVHTVSILFGAISAIIAAVHTGFFTTGNMCWIAPKPLRCDKNPNVECTSGNDYNTFRWALCGWPIIITFCIVTINMLIIFWDLYSQNNTTHITLGQHAPNNNNNNADAEAQTMQRRPSVIELYEASKKERKSSKARRDRKEGMIQALLYIVAFFMSYIFSIIYHGLDGTSKRPTIHLILLAKVFRSMQGFNNFLVFIRPSVVNIRNRNPSYSLYQAFVEAVQSRGENQRVMRKRPSTMMSQRRLSETRNVVISLQNGEEDLDPDASRSEDHVNETTYEKVVIDDRR